MPKIDFTRAQSPALGGAGAAAGAVAATGASALARRLVPVELYVMPLTAASTRTSFASCLIALDRVNLLGTLHHLVAGRQRFGRVELVMLQALHRVVRRLEVLCWGSAPR